VAETRSMVEHLSGRCPRQRITVSAKAAFITRETCVTLLDADSLCAAA
jgi:hypothetical protein